MSGREIEGGWMPGMEGRGEVVEARGGWGSGGLG